MFSPTNQTMAVPAWMSEEISSTSERIGDRQAVLWFGEN
jgi:hypothetical protein